MSDEEEDWYRDRARSAGKESVNEALRLLRSRSTKKKKRQTKYSEVERQRMNNYCSNGLEQMPERKKPHAKPFYHTFAIKELRNALLNQDYKSIQEIFPTLVKCLHNEPFMWRYAFLIYLLSPASNVSQFQDFLELCLGDEAISDGRVLEGLMTLLNTEQK